MNMLKVTCLFALVIISAGCGSASPASPAKTEMLPTVSSTYSTGGSPASSPCDYIAEAATNLNQVDSEMQTIRDKLTLGQSFLNNARNLSTLSISWHSEYTPSGLEAVKSRVEQHLKAAVKYALVLDQGGVGESEANSYLSTLNQAVDAVIAAKRLYNCP